MSVHNLLISHQEGHAEQLSPFHLSWATVAPQPPLLSFCSSSAKTLWLACPQRPSAQHAAPTTIPALQAGQVWEAGGEL